MQLYDHLLQGCEKSWSENKKREVETQKALIPGSSQSTPPQNLVVQLHLSQLVLHQPSASHSYFFSNLHSPCLHFSYLWQTRWCSGCSPPLDGCSEVADTLQAGTRGLSRVGRRELFPCMLHDLLWAPGASLSGQRAGSEAAALPSGKPRQLCLLARQVVWLRQCPEHAFASLSYVNNASGIRPFVHILTCKVRRKKQRSRIVWSVTEGFGGRLMWTEMEAHFSREALQWGWNWYFWHIRYFEGIDTSLLLSGTGWVHALCLHMESSLSPP